MTKTKSPKYPQAKGRDESRAHRRHGAVAVRRKNKESSMMSSISDQATYVFDEAIADRFRLLAYNFQATIDELLARTRVEPVSSGDVGLNETCFWETHAGLREQLNSNLDHEDENEALF
jgi:hypothetical protein